MMNADVYDAYEDARLKLEETVAAVRALADTCREHGAGESGMAHRRIEAYTLPHLKSWLYDEQQIGSFPRLWDELNAEEVCFDHGKAIPCADCEMEAEEGLRR